MLGGQEKWERGGNEERVRGDGWGKGGQRRPGGHREKVGRAEGDAWKGQTHRHKEWEGTMEGPDTDRQR